MSVINKITVGGVTYDVQDLISRPTLTYAQYQALEQAGQIDPNVDYHVTDLNVSGAPIDDTATASNKLWSSSKVSGELANKANTTDVNNKHKVTTKAVDLTNWSSDTTSQSGTTLYKKAISLTHVYANPSVDIGCASGYTLPTSAEQESYDLLQYVTCDDTVPCLYLYASDIPTTAFYINVEGVD